MFRDCTVERHMRLKRTILDTGELVREWWETRECGSPLFSEEERATGVCRSCLRGWMVPTQFPTGAGTLRIQEAQRQINT